MNNIREGEVTRRDRSRQWVGVGLRKKQIEIQWKEEKRQSQACCLFRVCLCHCGSIAEGLQDVSHEHWGPCAVLMSPRLSICHQSSADKGAASAGAHVISTICDSTREAPVWAKSPFFLCEGVENEGEKGEKYNFGSKFGGICIMCKCLHKEPE